MTRIMVDATHAGLPDALPLIRSLRLGHNIVALYDTGSPDIAATPSDLAEIPPQLDMVMIDQGFTGSPNPHATVRDCETGGWSLARAIDKAGWAVPRPTLYLGFPDTVSEAYDQGWRGDVWLVDPSSEAPVVPPKVPKGINVVAVQWNFANTEYDISAVFDDTWPRSSLMTVTIPDFSGQPAGEVHDKLVKLGLVPTATPGQRATEIVTSTEPGAGLTVPLGEHVVIVTTVHQMISIGKYILDLSGTLRLG